MPLLDRQSLQSSEDEIVLGLLSAYGEDQSLSQRRVAAELGVALGLVNAYVRRCVRKGLLKVKEVPAGRFAYYLTPEGFAEKSRLTAEYLTSSFAVFRRTRRDCAEVFHEARRRNWRRVALLGRSEIAEVAALCAIEAGLEIVAVVDPGQASDRFVGLPVVGDATSLLPGVDGFVLTKLGAYDLAADPVELVSRGLFLVPAILGSLAPRRPDAPEIVA